MTLYFMNGKCIAATLLILVLTFVHCRKSHRQPKDALSKSQKELSTVISGGTVDTVVAPKLLSLELNEIVAAYQKGTARAIDRSFQKKLDSITLLLSTTLLMETDGRKIVDAITDCIFNQWGITFNNDRNDVRFLFPSHVVREKQGSCVGMSLLYLLFAEKLGMPIYGVLAPGHMFVRYDNGKESINIETLRTGECMSAQWYREKYSIEDTLLYSLRNLSVAEVLAVVHYNMGTIQLNDKKFSSAERSLERAVTLFPDFIEAQGNLALVYDATGKSEKALERLLTIRNRHPSFKNIDRNIGPLQIKCGKYSEALETYGSLVKKSAPDPELYYGYAVALHRTGNLQGAIDALKKTLALRPGYREASELLAALSAGSRE